MKKKGRAPNANTAQLRAAAHRGMDRTMVFCLTALADKFGWEQEQLTAFIKAVANYADAVNRKFITYEDLHKVLVDEQGLEW